MVDEVYVGNYMLAGKGDTLATFGTGFIIIYPDVTDRKWRHHFILRLRFVISGP